VVRQMYFVQVPEARPVRAPALATGVAVLAAVVILAGGIYPDLFARLPGAAALVP
jgi:hypothetical protein